MKGLSEAEARRLLEIHGENRIKAKKKTSAFKLLAGQFQDALIIILLISTLISLAMGEYVEAITISAIVVINALLGFIQEFKTEKTLEKLGNLAAPTATVLRDGSFRECEAYRLVPGDIVKLQAGSKVPADGEFLSCSAVTADESMLSGESIGVSKKVGDSAYMGTNITAGSATVKITKTGEHTEMGKIAGMLEKIETSATPLQKRLAQLSKYIGIGALAICAVVAICGILRGEPIFDMLLCGISLAVAAVPEGLPAIVTIALALSISRMVSRRALTKKLHAVETLGCADIICSDKTGTLTENRMTVQKIALWEKIYDADEKLHGNQIETIMITAASCNNATVTYKNKKPKFFGEATEVALLTIAEKYGVKKTEVIDEIPFDSNRKMMSVLTSDDKIYSKGAPDILLTKCTHILTSSGVREMSVTHRRKILSQNEQMAANALRVLAFAYRESATLCEEKLIFVGLMGMLDPPRREAYTAVKKCKDAGIRPIMITGDHASTARAIASKLKILNDDDIVMTGSELDTADDDKLLNLLPKISVFARVTPAHKLRIVKAFKSLGHIVAMTGDGVNDAPAIKEADIGVSMGITGTDVTKEAADVILLDDNFATLVSAVEEGRVIYSNIRKFIRYLLSCNIGEVVTMFFAMLFGLPIPLIPIQILLINLVTDGLPAIALSLEPAEDDTMKRLPRSADESVFSNGLAKTICIRGLLIGLTTLGVFYMLYIQSNSIALARTGALLTLVLTQLIHVFECKSETRGLLAIPIFNNKPLLFSVLCSIIFMYLVIYTQFFSSIFQTVPLSGKHLITVLLFCLTVPIISSFLKKTKG